MSGAGKSHWTRKLDAAGFRAISVDDRIEEKLAPELSAGGYRGIGGVAAWMGWPDQPEYRDREQKYLASEIESMREALDEVEASGEDGIVLDTTGSVVYTGEEICRPAAAPHDGRVPRGFRWRRGNLDRAIPFRPETRPLGQTCFRNARVNRHRTRSRGVTLSSSLIENNSMSGSRTSLSRWRACGKRRRTHVASLKSSIRRHGPRDEIS